MDFDLAAKLAIYRYFAETGKHRSPTEISQRVGATSGEVTEAYRRLRDQRVLVVESDGVSVRVAPLGPSPK